MAGRRSTKPKTGEPKTAPNAGDATGATVQPIEAEPGAFRYVGDHPDMECFGIVFRAGGKDLDPMVNDSRALLKLRGNNHFKEVK